MNHIRNTRDWTAGKSFKLRFQYRICFEVNDSPLCVIGIFIFCCSLSKNGFTNGKIQSSSSAISKCIAIS